MCVFPQSMSLWHVYKWFQIHTNFYSTEVYIIVDNQQNCQNHIRRGCPSCLIPVKLFARDSIFPMLSLLSISINWVLSNCWFSKFPPFKVSLAQEGWFAPRLGYEVAVFLRLTDCDLRSLAPRTLSVNKWPDCGRRRGLICAPAIFVIFAPFDLFIRALDPYQLRFQSVRLPVCLNKTNELTLFIVYWRGVMHMCVMLRYRMLGLKIVRE